MIFIYIALSLCISAVPLECTYEVAHNHLKSLCHPPPWEKDNKLTTQQKQMVFDVHKPQWFKTGGEVRAYG